MNRIAKKLVAILAVITLMMPVSVFAQISLEDYNKTRDELNAKISALETEKQALNKQLTDKDQELTRVTKELEQIRKAADKQNKKETDAQKSQIKKIEKERDEALTQLKKLQKEFDDYKAQYGKDQAENLAQKQSALDKEIEELRKQNRELKEENDALESIKRLQIEQNRPQYEALAKLPFHEMDAEALATALKQCSYFPQDLQDVAQALQVAKTGHELYESVLVYCETELYNEDKVKTMESLLKSRIGQAIDNADQLQDLNDAKSMLMSYRIGIIQYKYLISQLIGDSMLKTLREGENSRAIDRLEELLASEGLQNAIERIQKIPYLKNHLDRYLQDLRENPYKFPVIQSEIQSITQ